MQKNDDWTEIISKEKGWDDKKAQKNAILSEN